MGLFAKCVALFIFILFIPIFFVVSMLSLIFQGRPIFFKQKRVGKDFKIFILYKFRTMINTTKNDYSLDNVNRTTAWGKILRRSKIDELPQLINIILGDMRFIGPRPEIPYYVDKKKYYIFNLLEEKKIEIADFEMENNLNEINYNYEIF